jgi:hypothetical protein
VVRRSVVSTNIEKSSRYSEGQGRALRCQPGYELESRGIEMSWQLQNNGKKGIRL